MSNEVNPSIKCSVCSCAYHNSDDYCSLESIKVGTDTSNPTAKCETECLSFECTCHSK